MSSLIPRPRFPTVADGLHHRYVESFHVYPSAAIGNLGLGTRLSNVLVSKTIYCFAMLTGRHDLDKQNIALLLLLIIGNYTV